jgi:hypothetical protein
MVILLLLRFSGYGVWMPPAPSRRTRLVGERLVDEDVEALANHLLDVLQIATDDGDMLDGASASASLSAVAIRRRDVRSAVSTFTGLPPCGSRVSWWRGTRALRTLAPGPARAHPEVAW